jgi:DNA-binding NarL/FixJ family response regulator
VAHTRVLLIGMPKLLREIVRGFVATDPSLEFVGEVDDPAAGDAAVAQSRADFVITAAEASAGAGLGPRLMSGARVKVLAVSPDASDSFLYVPLGEVAPARLLALIRAAARPPFRGDG